MQKEEYLIKNACYSVTKYYLCKRNNKRSLSGRKQRLEVVRSFPNRYQFSCINKVTSLFSNRYIFIIILTCKKGVFELQKYGFCFLNVALLQSVRHVFAICSPHCCNPFATYSPNVRYIVAIRLPRIRRMSPHCCNPFATFSLSVSSAFASVRHIVAIRLPRFRTS